MSCEARAAASIASGLTWLSAPGILIRRYQTSIHSKTALRASACVRRRRSYANSFFGVAQRLSIIALS
jgi:hypothetical protein